MAPTALTAGVILYEHANFLGNSAHLTADIADLRDFRGPCFEGDDASSRDWNDCVSSVRVAPGWRATLYRESDYGDDALEITEDVANLQLVRQHDCDQGGLNDCVRRCACGNSDGWSYEKATCHLSPDGSGVANATSRHAIARHRNRMSVAAISTAPTLTRAQLHEVHIQRPPKQIENRETREEDARRGHGAPGRR